MPVLIGGEYGTARIGGICGRRMISYGAAGLLAPALSGRLFSAGGSCAAAIATALAMCLAGLLLGLTMRKTRKGP